MTISNPQKVFIGPWDHGAANDADPFQPFDTPVRPSRDQQFDEMMGFFDGYLKKGLDADTESSVSYYTLGADRWSTTETWPPADFATESWYFAEDGLLSMDAPESDSGSDNYRIDFEASTGLHNR